MILPALALIFVACGYLAFRLAEWLTERDGDW